MPASKFKGEISLEAAEPMPETTIKRSNVDLSQYVEVLRQSMAQTDDEGFGVVMGTNIPADAEQTAISRFRNAAKELGTGVKFGSITTASPQAADYGLTPDKIRLLVQTKPKQKSSGGRPRKSAAKSTKGGK